jgi:hypothetical protein
MAEDLQHLIHLEVAAVDRRNLVLPRQLIQVRGEVLEERRQLEALLEALLAQLVVAHARGQPRHQGLGLDAVARMIETGSPASPRRSPRRDPSLRRRGGPSGSRAAAPA